MYFNNPCRVAYQESKLLWPDVEDCHPDILLSIGTGHNGKETTGSAEPRRRLQKPKPPNLQEDSPVTVKKQRGLRAWARDVAIVQCLRLMVNRVDNILSAEQIWHDFRLWVEDSHGREGHRYVRVSPKLGYGPPKLDETSQVDTLSSVVVSALRGLPGYRIKIAQIVHRLVASCFYFETRGSPEEAEGFYRCKGTMASAPMNGATC